DAVRELHYAFFLAEQLSASGVRAMRTGASNDRETLALIPNATIGGIDTQDGLAKMNQSQLLLRGLQLFFAALAIAITSAVDEIKEAIVDFCTFYRDTSKCPIPDCEHVKGEYDYEFYWLVIITGALVCCYALVLFFSQLRPSLAA